MLRLAVVLACLAETGTAFGPVTHGGSASRSYALSRGQRSANPLAQPAPHQTRSGRLSPLGATAELAAGWLPHVDEASGQTYYCNSQTGECQWELPETVSMSMGADVGWGTGVNTGTTWSIDAVNGVAGFSGVDGVTINTPQGDKYLKFTAANKFAGALHTEHDDVAYRLEHGRDGRPCQLPYLVSADEDKVLSRYNMINQKQSVSRGQCKVRVFSGGGALLISRGESPTLWRRAGGPWNMLYKDEEQSLSDGDQISLDCDDPEGAVFVCTAPGGVGGQQQQPADLTARLDAGWESHVDEASGQTYYVNSQTGESQWEPPW